MRFLKIAIISVITLASVNVVQAQRVSKAGTSAAQFLRIPVGARSVGIGLATTASANDLSAMYWNPAMIAEVRQPGVMAEFADWLVDLNHSYLAIAIPASSKSTIGFSINALTMGEFEETTLQNPEGTGRTFTAFSYAVGVTYSHFLFETFAIGGTVKYINETIWNTAASTLAFDVGTIFTTPFKGLRFGASVTNAGGRMQMQGDDLLINTQQLQNSSGEYNPDAYLRTDPFDLPLQLKIGFAYDAVNNESVRASFYLDGTNPSDNKQSISIGTEIGLLKDVIQLRAGLPELGLEDRVTTFTAGVGLNYALSDKLGFNVGYAYQDYQFFGGTNRMTVTINF